MPRNPEAAFSAPIGATVLEDGRTRFRVWAPNAESVTLVLEGRRAREVVMTRDGFGYFELVLPDAGPGTRYQYRLAVDGTLKNFPDPASRFQPEGVHGPSEVANRQFNWTDLTWKGLPVRDAMIYELHVGAWTEAGTFDAAREKLGYLQELGITAVEIMPVAEFPGNRNWGYDGVYPFAVQSTYGGPEAFKRFVNACHEHGLAVFLDVVYNHLGPEGNTLREFGPYFTRRYQTPWGAALNYDGAESDPVRNFFLQNVTYWIEDCHVDGLRLDAVHAIYDLSGNHLLGEIARRVKRLQERLGRTISLIAETDLNDSRFIRELEVGGHGLDSLWSDDFHHALHAYLTSESNGYYQDFGRIEDLAKAFREGFVYTGQYSAYRKRRHGTRVVDLPASRFVAFAQNHDQVGNRMRGERLSTLIPFERLKLAAGLTLLSPFTPLLFMGEEYAETSPFLYFVSHSDPGLIEAVRQGRRREFAPFFREGVEAPDPQEPGTFEKSKLNLERSKSGTHATVFRLYQRLISLAKELRASGLAEKEYLDVDLDVDLPVLILNYSGGAGEFEVVFNFGDRVTDFRRPLHAGKWTVAIDSSDAEFGGPGSLFPEKLRPGSFVALWKESDQG